MPLKSYRCQLDKTQAATNRQGTQEAGQHIHTIQDTAQLSMITLRRQITRKTLLITPKFHHPGKNCVDFSVDSVR